MTPAMSVGLAGAAVLLIGTALYGEQVVVRAAEPGKVTVVYWEKWTGAEGEEMRKVVNAFNRSQDRILVKYLSISSVDQKTLLATAGGEPPDIAGIWQEQVAQFADANALTDLTPMATSAGLTRDYYIPGYYDPLTYRGRLWAVPSTPASIALHVRTDLVPPDYASPATFPKTIEGMDELAFQISKKDPAGGLTLAGFLPSSPGWWNWAWGGYFGESLMRDGRIVVNGPGSVRAFKWIQSYAKKFGSTQVQSFQSGFGNFSSPQDPFMSGKVAMEQNGVWKGNYIKVQKPDTPWFAVPFPYPADLPNLANHSNLSQDILAIPKGSKHPAEAFEFLKYVQRQDVMEGLCIGHGKNSPLAKVSEHFFQAHPNRFIRLFDKLARTPNTFYAPPIGIWKQVNDEIGVAFQEVNTLQKEPKQALDDAQARIDTDWETYKEQVLGGAG